MMFGPDRRVRKRIDFQRIQRLGQRISTKDFVWILARAESAGQASRLGITASKRVGNAVRRNRIKRVIRAAFRELEGMVPQGFDLVVICKPQLTELNTETVVQQWRSIDRRVQKALSKLRSNVKTP